MSNTCDHTSVGIIIRRKDSFALIKRKNFPVSFAFPAGHLDGDTYEKAAIREAREETGIRVAGLREVLDMNMKNPCKRENGTFHHWRVFEAEKRAGDIIAGSDAAHAFWASRAALRALIEKTVSFQERLGIRIEDLKNFVPALAQGPEWIRNPGLEPAWVVILRALSERRFNFP